MKNFLRLIRWQNLLMIIITFVLLRYCIASSIVKVNGYELVMPWTWFAALVAAVVFIAAGGYVINNYFDAEADKINDKNNPIPQLISPSTAITLYIIFSVIGFLLGLWVSIKVGHPRFSLIFFIAASLLWFYSSAFKKSFLLGNIIIAFLTALVPMLVAIYDVPLLLQHYSTDVLIYNIDFNVITYWMIAYAIFAFGFTLVREIVKDIEDMDGDIAAGANTLPIVLGQNTAKFIAIVLDLALMAILGYAIYKYLTEVWTFIYFVVFLALPDMVFIFLLIVGKNKNHFHWASNIIKLIMLAGILYSLLACYIFSTL